jgi:hypothetical protein
MRNTLMLRSMALIGIHFLFICPVVFGADLLIKLESYIPLEKCSMSFSVYSDGSAKYKGRHCSRRSINIRPHLSATEVESIRQLIREVRFCELRDDYSADNNNEGYVVMDSETLGITTYCGNITKSVSVYGIFHIIETDMHDFEHPDRDAVRRFDRLNIYVFDLLTIKGPL